MTTIYALMICLTFTNPQSAKYNNCAPPENGWLIFKTAEECQRVADHSNVNNPPQPGVGVFETEKCFQKTITINTWTPAS